MDEELLMDEEENRRELAFIREQVPADVKEKYSDAQILWMMDTIVDYYFSSGILESADEEVEIDLEKVADYVCEQAKKEKQGTLDPQEVFFVVQADLDFQEQNC
ncbi:MAG: hypothetical protein K6D91_06270 [Prevotella sp.]|nr:hypothetical protein [Prevotella sp.]